MNSKIVSLKRIYNEIFSEIDIEQLKKAKCYDEINNKSIPKHYFYVVSDFYEGEHKDLLFEKNKFIIYIICKIITTDENIKKDYSGYYIFKFAWNDNDNGCDYPHRAPVITMLTKNCYTVYNKTYCNSDSSYHQDLYRLKRIESMILSQINFLLDPNEIKFESSNKEKIYLESKKNIMNLYDNSLNNDELNKLAFEEFNRNFQQARIECANNSMKYNINFEIKEINFMKHIFPDIYQDYINDPDNFDIENKNYFELYYNNIDINKFKK